MKLINKIEIKDAVIVALLTLGILSDLNFLDVPFWGFLIIGAFYFGMWSGWATNNPIKE
jgi:hypothetical protein